MCECRNTQALVAASQSKHLYNGLLHRNEYGKAADELQLPCDVVACARACRVSDKFQCLDCLTSAELVAEVLQEFAADVDLFSLQYDVNTSIDESLLWSTIHGKTLVGKLLEPGQKAALLSSELAMVRKRKREERAMKLRTDDPLAEPVAKRRRVTSKRGGSKAAAKARGHGANDNRNDNEPAQAGPPDEAPADDAAGGQEDAAAHADREALGDDIMDVADNDMDDIDGNDSDVSDFEKVYLGVHTAEDDPAPYSVIDDAANPLVPDAGVAAVVIEQLDSNALEMAGLLPDDPGGAAPGPSDALPPPPAPPPPERWETLTGPNAAGYYKEDFRDRLRVQRGKPVNSCTVNCYFHPNCKLLLAMSRTPPDDELKRWLFAVRIPSPEESRDVRQALAKEHSALGYSKWGAKAGRK